MAEQALLLHFHSTLQHLHRMASKTPLGKSAVFVDIHLFLLHATGLDESAAETAWQEGDKCVSDKGFAWPGDMSRMLSVAALLAFRASSMDSSTAALACSMAAAQMPVHQHVSLYKHIR